MSRQENTLSQLELKALLESKKPTMKKYLKDLLSRLKKEREVILYVGFSGEWMLSSTLRTKCPANQKEVKNWAYDASIKFDPKIMKTRTWSSTVVDKLLSSMSSTMDKTSWYCGLERVQ